MDTLTKTGYPAIYPFQPPSHYFCVDWKLTDFIWEAMSKALLTALNIALEASMALRTEEAIFEGVSPKGATESIWPATHVK